jgi:Domain of Unknown Function (DUF1259)
MRKLAGEGIEITALHNHLLRAAPATLYMYVLGRGDPVKLAAATRHGADRPDAGRQRQGERRRLSSGP